VNRHIEVLFIWGKYKAILIIFVRLKTHIILNTTPDILFGQLFADVQLSSVFADNKTFVDCIPKFAPVQIMANYEIEKQKPNFDLKAFVLAQFELPKVFASDFEANSSDSPQAHINKLWPYLTRQPELPPPYSSLLYLPNPYIVPGGRFGEIYYWDTYFTALGLQVAGNDKAIENIADNFAYFIDQYGHIPNGNRTYFLSRSQPPFFSLIVELLGETFYGKYKLVLEKEYEFWTNGTVNLATKQAFRRVVKIPDGTVLNRYFDDANTPRQESYREDVELSHQTQGPPSELFRNIRAACESGWDFSSRWFKDPHDLSTIHTLDIVPVDLNCLLYHLEMLLAIANKDNSTKQADFENKAQIRKNAILKYCYNENLQTFTDFDFVTNQPTDSLTLAMVYPLFFKIATDQQAQKIAEILEKKFLKNGGLITTTINNGQQWDAPNGWPCLQYLAIVSLQNYQFDTLANTIIERWLQTNTTIFKQTGKMLEKYNVENSQSIAVGGEYLVQDGFGWTNGVFLKLLKDT
jgi:alpha,alpha-trehalase